MPDLDAQTSATPASAPAAQETPAPADNANGGENGQSLSDAFDNYQEVGSDPESSLEDTQVAIDKIVEVIPDDHPDARSYKHLAKLTQRKIAQSEKAARGYNDATRNLTGRLASLEDRVKTQPPAAAPAKETPVPATPAGEDDFVGTIADTVVDRVMTKLQPVVDMSEAQKVRLEAETRETARTNAEKAEADFQKATNQVGKEIAGILEVDFKESGFDATDRSGPAYDLFVAGWHAANSEARATGRPASKEDVLQQVEKRVINYMKSKASQATPAPKKEVKAETVGNTAVSTAPGTAVPGVEKPTTLRGIITKVVAENYG